MELVLSLIIIILCVIVIYLCYKNSEKITKVFAVTVIIFIIFLGYEVINFVSSVKVYVKNSNVISEDTIKVNSNIANNRAVIGINCEFIDKTIEDVKEKVFFWEYGKKATLEEVTMTIRNYLGIHIDDKDKIYVLKNSNKDGILLVRQEKIYGFIPNIEEDTSIYDILNGKVKMPPLKSKEEAGSLKNGCVYKWKIIDGYVKVLVREIEEPYFKLKPIKVIFFKDGYEEGVETISSNILENKLKEVLDEKYSNYNIVYIKTEKINEKEFDVYGIIEGDSLLAYFYVDKVTGDVFQLDILKRKLIKIR